LYFVRNNAMDPTINPWAHLPLIVGGLAGLSVFTLVLGFGRAWRALRASPLERLQVIPLPAVATAVDGPAMRSNRPNGAMARLESELRQAGLVVTASEFMLAIIFVTALGMLFSWWLHNGILGIVLLGAGVFGPRYWLRWRLAKRVRDLGGQCRWRYHPYAGEHW
jgi:hypothetical protein